MIECAVCHETFDNVIDAEYHFQQYHPDDIPHFWEE